MNIRRIILGATLLAAVAGVATSPARAFDLSQLMGHGNNDPTLETFKLIHVADLKTLMETDKNSLHIYDANAAETRDQYGVIPGATLLNSDDNYDLALLPTDKDATLVFYCANTLCTASHEAARRAVKAGYEDVSVMGDGIRGWKQAGQPTTKTTTTEGRSS
ncbi:MAG: rhodanese-like domain-containing protein [Candidatus Binataceae bacterium]